MSNLNVDGGLVACCSKKILKVPLGSSCFLCNLPIATAVWERGAGCLPCQHVLHLHCWDQHCRFSADARKITTPEDLLYYQLGKLCGPCPWCARGKYTIQPFDAVEEDAIRVGSAVAVTEVCHYSHVVGSRNNVVDR